MQGKKTQNLMKTSFRNSPHNFKKQNAESGPAAKGQEKATTTETKFKSPLVYFTIPQFSGIVSVETSIEVKKPKLESFEKHIENLFNFPIF
jgi:hypothetical protein